MSDVLLILSILLRVFWFLLLARIIVEMVRSFSRNWNPSGFLVVVFEWIFTITDPPVKALRKVIPPARLGGVSLDLSVLVLFLILFVLQIMLGVAASQVV